MAQTESQLEIWKIILGRKTVRQILEEKAADEEKATDEEINLNNDNEFSNYLYRKFLCKLTQDTAWKSGKTKLGLALFANNEDEINTILKNHSAHSCIEGFIDGGPYDKIKTIAQTTDVSQRELLGRDKMVTERFYMYLYLPLGAKIGLLFIEKKGSLKISSAVQELIVELLKTHHSAVRFERFVPHSLIDEYKNGSVVDTLTFTDYMTTSVIDGNDENTIVKQYGVTIRITPPAEDRTGIDLVHNMLNALREASMKLGIMTKPLSEFSTKRGTLRKENQSYSFTLGNDLKIKPMIEIEDEFQDEEHGVLKRADIKSLCDGLLAQIRDEIYAV